MATLDFTAAPTPQDVAPGIGATAIDALRLRNIDANGVLFLRESATAPPSDARGIRLRPGESYACLVSPSNRLFAWTDSTSDLVDAAISEARELLL